MLRAILLLCLAVLALGWPNNLPTPPLKPVSEWLQEYAYGRPTFVSSKYTSPGYCTDDNPRTWCGTHRQWNPWIRINIGPPVKYIHKIQIWNRNDCCQSRANNVYVYAGMNSHWARNKRCSGNTNLGRMAEYNCGGVKANYVHAVLKSLNYFHVSVIRVWGIPISNTRKWIQDRKDSLERHFIALEQKTLLDQEKALSGDLKNILNEQKELTKYQIELDKAI